MAPDLADDISFLTKYIEIFILQKVSEKPAAIAISVPQNISTLCAEFATKLQNDKR